jgi:hypothetical protein
MQDRFSTFEYRSCPRTRTIAASPRKYRFFLDAVSSCRGLRASTFVGSGMSGVFPVVHMLYIGLEGNWISLQYISLMGFLYAEIESTLHYNCFSVFL